MFSRIVFDIHVAAVADEVQVSLGGFCADFPAIFEIIRVLICRPIFSAVIIQIIRSISV